MSNTGSEVDDLPLDPEYAEEEEEEEEEEAVIEEEPSIYYSEDFISGPILSEESTLPGNILEFDYSFGYDCKRHYNLTVADEKTLIFASGNLINFFNTETKELSFRRSAFGGGIGHITKNPNPEFPHIAIAENGIKPPIIVYDWPSLEIVCLLKDGAARGYTHLNYSPDGLLLASQGGEPDHLITIFNWVKSRILLRTKSYVNDVFRVMFSPDVPGQLTSCGLSHIKFWKMARTFTGLKLQGELGRFGKTEYCDILGIYPMPDEKVVSGCQWGNILQWDEGLIKVEVCRKNKIPCHDAPITQFYYSNGDLWSIGMDGRIRVWFYDTIDQSDPPDDDRFVQMEPIYDFYAPGVQYMCIYKQNRDLKNTFYYAQDGNGGLWRIDLNTDVNPEPPEQLYKCHAGAVVDIAPCPWGPYLASLGIDGRLHLYQYVDQKLLFIHQFPAKGSAMIWLPLKVQMFGDQLIMGFDDGNLRVVVLNIPEDPNKIKATTIQITKPHNRPVTKISLNESGTVLVSGGKDATIFIYQVLTERQHYSALIPIGYIPVPGIVTYLTWHHEHDTVILVGCIHGHFVQVEVPTEPQPYTTITYILKITPQHQRFTTYKAQIRRDIKISEIEARKAAKVAKKREEMEKIKAENPGLDIDEEVFLADSESEEELEPLHIPEIPNRILWMQTTDEGTIWLSMAGYDAGYIYEYYIDQTIEIPSRFQIIYNTDDIEINSYVYNQSKTYLFLAMQDGSVRVVKVNPDDWRDLSDYWQLSMHDNYNGFVPKMCFSYNENYFFTCGHDGNIFSYKFYPEDDVYFTRPDVRLKYIKTLTAVEDENGYINLSLEETIVRAEYDRKQRLANEHKRILLEKLRVLRERFEKVLHRNEKLPPTQIIPRAQLEIDPRITIDLEERLGADIALVKRKLAFSVEKSKIAMTKLLNHFTDPVDLFPITVKGIQTKMIFKSCRQRKLTEKFDEMLGIIEQKIIEAELKGRYKLQKNIQSCQ